MILSISIKLIPIRNNSKSSITIRIVDLKKGHCSKKLEIEVRIFLVVDKFRKEISIFFC